MDFLDTRKQQRTSYMLFLGYSLVTIAIAIATTILLYQAYGFGIGKNGTVIQDGLAFFSSQPNPVNIYLNGVRNPNQTNARLELPEGIYNVKLTLNGYRSWQHTIELTGGKVEHFDYPLLIPSKLTSKRLQTYSARPNMVTQSPDRRWMLVQAPGSMTAFDVFDLNNPTKAPTDISLPANLISKATGSEVWQLVEWADDNQHILLAHNYDGKTEYVLVDRSNPTQSVNLTNNLSLPVSTTKLTLDNKKYDRYYLYSASTGDLQTLSLSSANPVTVVQHVLAYETYGSNTVLYITDKGAPHGKVLIRLNDGDTTYTLHSLVSGTNYLVDLTQYSGTLYVAAGASSENKVYIYKDPIGQLNEQPHQAVAPSQVLHVIAPDYVSFSTNAQFIMTENGTQFGVYDIENEKGYNYILKMPLDAPQQHASWMDGDRLVYVSGGKLVMVDYDGTNPQTLIPADSDFIPAFDPNYHYVYTLSLPASTNQSFVYQTSLLTS